MKKNNILITLTVLLCMFISGCTTEKKENSEPQKKEDIIEPAVDTVKEEDKTIIIYFSRAGENYNVGNVEKGNTEILAEIIADETGYEIFKLETVKEYPVSYDEMLDVAKAEKNSGERPELKSRPESLEGYSRIILGYPIWWADMPMAVYTFLESYDFSGKTIYPFDTHGGSGLANTVKGISNVTGATVEEGLAVLGSTAQNNREETVKLVREWLEDSGLFPEN